jgi:predicted N-acyltransferase
MGTAEATMQIRWHQGIGEIDATEWDRLALPLETPLLEWQWLHLLEDSGSIAPQTGWYPRHLTVWQGERLVGAAPLYLKTHSGAEFVFDQWWARWADEEGIDYYPKLVGMSPATPAVGYRFLVDTGAAAPSIQQAMFDAIDHFCLKAGISGCHLLFVDPDWIASAADIGFVPWQHQSFLWRNRGYASFEDYLKPFKSIQRRNIRRERRRMQQAGITIRPLTGDQIPPDLAGLMYRYYLNTNAQYGPWAARYLNAAFFETVFKHYRHRLLLAAAYHPSAGDQPLALSMLLLKGHTLIGRYWGCAVPVKDLHFNMCFYAPIQWAIENRIDAFDPGAGSPHKIYRGFEAVANISLHRFYEPRLKMLFKRFINEINHAEQANIDALNEQLPFAAVSDRQQTVKSSIL